MKYLISAAVVVILGLGAWYVMSVRQASVGQPEVQQPARIVPQAAPTPEAETPPPPETSPVDEGAQPLAEQDTGPEPLPPLAESDAAVTGALSVVVGEEAVNEYVAQEDVVARIVATADALSGKQVPASIRAVEGPPGEFLAQPDANPPEVIRNSMGDPIPQYVADPANYDRYTPYVQALEGADAAAVAAAYQTYRPLFEEAFSQLGYPEGDFDQRLLSLIDELLATPEPAGPVRLIKPEAYFLYADKSLESLTAGQKILLRMGPDNAARVKAQLREIRAQLQAG